MYAEVMYCQSKLKEKRPRPSLAWAPPNKLVNVVLTESLAFREARQKTDTPFSQGKLVFSLVQE